MQYAIADGLRREAFPGGGGHCPLCGGGVVARCGEINAWHWAHRSRRDCDSWAEGEGLWHLTWKRRFYKQWREVAVGSHRADVYSPQGVIELQASAISVTEIAERESFYGEMVWLVDARRFSLDLRDRGSHVTFRWKHPRKTWWNADKTLYFDLGTRLLRIHRVHGSIPCGGSGRYVTYEDFVKAFSRPKLGHALCGDCRRPLHRTRLIETGMTEFYTLDVDPGMLLCADCHGQRCDDRTPDDPALWDCLTPVGRFC